MIEATTEALQQMARHVATQLVADALKSMVIAPITVTLHPQAVVGQGIVQAPRLLGPAKRRGRKPGPKPAGTRKWTPAQRAKFKASMAARRKPAPAAAGVPEKRKLGRPRKVVDADRCLRCDHTKGEHDAQTGKCLSAKCSCTEFWK